MKDVKYVELDDAITVISFRPTKDVVRLLGQTRHFFPGINRSGIINYALTLYLSKILESFSHNNPDSMP